MGLKKLFKAILLFAVIVFLTQFAQGQLLQWRQVASGGFGTGVGDVSTFHVFKNYIYASCWTGTIMELRRSADGETWEKLDIGIMEQSSGILAMTEFNGHFYVGTSSRPHGSQIWRTMDGINWEMVVDNGFDTTNVGIYCFIEFNDYLYVGTWCDAGGQIWRTPDGEAWEKANTNGFGNSNNVAIFCLNLFEGHLYAGTDKWTDGCEVWRSNDGTSWERVVSNGFGNLQFNDAVSSLEVFNGNIYAGTWTYQGGFEIWKSPDGLFWERGALPGFADPVNTLGINTACYFRTIGDFLYVVTMQSANSVHGGGQVWRTGDGSNWERISDYGFGNINNIGFWTIEYFNGHLYVGTLNRAEGAEIWTSSQPVEIPPEISLLNPDSGIVGTEVIISGSGFGSIQGTVTFNGIFAPIMSWSHSQIITNVPLGATSGPVAVITNDGKISSGVNFTVLTEPPVKKLEYTWIFSDPSEPLMDRNYTIVLRIYNPDDNPQIASFSLEQVPDIDPEAFPWGDPGWQESIKMDIPYDEPFLEGETYSITVNGKVTREIAFTLNNKWNWIEPYGVENVANIVASILSNWADFEVTDLSISLNSLFNFYVPHVSEINFLYSGHHSDKPYQNFSIEFSVPPEKYTLFGTSILASIAGSKCTVVGIVLLPLPHLAVLWFVAEAISIGISEYMYYLATDPDPEYEQIVSPEFISIPEIESIENKHHRKIANTMLDAYSYLKAAFSSYVKYETAEDANDSIWMTIHLELTKQYMSQHIDLMQQTSQMLYPELSNVPVPNEEEIPALKNWIVENGLPEIEIKILEALGFSPEEITSLSQSMADLPDNIFTLFPDIPQVMMNIANGMDSVIGMLPSIPSDVIMSFLDFDPDMFNLSSKGKWVTCYIELPTGYNIASINISSLILNNSIYAISTPINIGDYNNNGIPDLMVKFSRESLISLLVPGDQSIVLTGTLVDGTPIVGIDVIRVKE